MTNKRAGVRVTTRTSSSRSFDSLRAPRMTNEKVQKQIPSLRCGMTNKKATTEILAFGQNDGQEQKQMLGFFAALRMTNKRAGVRVTSYRGYGFV